jgi:hypothetical protein
LKNIKKIDNLGSSNQVLISGHPKMTDSVESTSNFVFLTISYGRGSKEPAPPAQHQRLETDCLSLKHAKDPLGSSLHRLRSISA